MNNLWDNAGILLKTQRTDSKMFPCMNSWMLPEIWTKTNDNKHVNALFPLWILNVLSESQVLQTNFDNEYNCKIFLWRELLYVSSICLKK
jgi:hypothetical protein